MRLTKKMLKEYYVEYKKDVVLKVIFLIKYG